MQVATAERRHDRSTFARDVASVDPVLLDFCEVFVPGLLDDPESFADRISLPLPDGSWRPWSWLVKEHKLAPLDPLRLVRLHVDAGMQRKPQTIPGLPFGFHAIGVKLHPWTCIPFVNLDLDDGPSKPSPTAYIDALRRIGACPLVTPGSGNPRRFRALLRLASPMPVEQMQLLMSDVFRGLGMKPPEIYPSTKIPSRLPGGNRACVRFYPDDLTLNRPRPLPIVELLHAWHDLPAFDLDAAYDRFVPRRELEQDTHWTNPDEPKPSDAKPRKRKGKPRGLTSGERADVERYRREGIRPDERLQAIKLLVKDDWSRRLSREECCESMKEWIRDGKIKRSNHFRKQYKSRYIAVALADIPRHVENLYRLYETSRPKPRQTTANLSARDVRALVPIVERAAKQAKSTIERAGLFALAMLPLWKGTDEQTRTQTGIRVHRDKWRDAAGDRGDYARLRASFDLWLPVSGYLPATHAAGKNPYSTAWTCSFTFDESSPERALGRTWETAVKRAMCARDKP